MTSTTSTVVLYLVAPPTMALLDLEVAGKVNYWKLIEVQVGVAVYV